jgi:hypothetical protein
VLVVPALDRAFGHLQGDARHVPAVGNFAFKIAECFGVPGLDISFGDRWLIGARKFDDVAHACTAFPALIKASIAAAMLARS